MQTLLVPIQIVKTKTALFIPKKSCDSHMMSGHMIYGCLYDWALTGSVGKSMITRWCVWIRNCSYACLYADRKCGYGHDQCMLSCVSGLVVIVCFHTEACHSGFNHFRQHPVAI